MTGAAALQRLLTWLSRSFPAGACARSSELESAIAEKAATDSVFLQNRIAAPARDATTALLADLGSIAYAADFAQMHHQTLEPRVFRP